MEKIINHKGLLFLLIILAVSVFFRLWQLDSIPPGLYPDVAMNGNNALETLRTAPPAGGFKVFYPDNNGREGLFIWLIAFSFSVFGISIWSIKIVAATIGILTVFGLYLLTKELFSIYYEAGSRKIALLASFFLAISFWHTNFSRIGFRAILLPFILVFGFYYLFKGFRLGSADSPPAKTFSNFIISGIFFGLGFYTYISYRFIVLLLPVVLISWWLIYRKEKSQKKCLFFIFYFLFFIFITTLPLGFYFLQNPQDFIGRATPISIFASENPLGEFGKSLILHLGMFNFYGDPNWRHNFAGSPMLFWPIGILFLIGVFYSIYNLAKSLLLHRGELFAVFGLLVSWWLIMLLPGILTFEGIPHSLRVIGAMPPVFIFAGLGAYKIYEFLNDLIVEQSSPGGVGKGRKKLLIFVSLFFLFALGLSEFNKYFVIWARHPKVEEAFTKKYYDIGNFLNFLPSEIQKYVIVNEPGSPLYGISIPAQTPIFVESTKYGMPGATYLRFEDLDQIKIDGKKTIIIPLYDGRTFAELSKKFPQGEIKKEQTFEFYQVY